MKLKKNRPNINSKHKTRGKKGYTVVNEKDGLKVDPSQKIQPVIVPSVVGMSKGVTLNTGDYESFRVDVWMNSYVEDGETIEDAYNRISNILDAEINKQIDTIEGD